MSTRLAALAVVVATGCTTTHYVPVDTYRKGVAALEWRLEYLGREIGVAHCGTVLNYCLHGGKPNGILPGGTGNAAECSVEYQECIIQQYGERK